MEPVNITICGTPSPETLAALFEVAANAGLGFVLPPRALPPATVEEVARPERRKLPGRTAFGPRRTEKPGLPAQPPVVVGEQATPAFSKTAQNEAAAHRREVIVKQLRRAGDAGLSFKALLDAMRPVLAAAGDSDQQVGALRNALSTLGRDGRVKRVAGQWLACD